MIRSPEDGPVRISAVACCTAAISVLAVATTLLSGCGGGSGGGGGGPGPTPAATLPPEVALGERLFRETRFAQFFAANFGNDVNVSPPPADPVLAVTLTATGSLPGALTGPTMSCRGCHLHTEAAGFAVDFFGGALRTYGDFARRSPIPLRGDGLTLTPRNSPPLVGVAVAHTAPFILHFDGEFVTGAALSRSTLTGRNFGWLIGEEATAKAHIARVIREDDGTSALAADVGGLSYSTLLRGDPVVPAQFLIPAGFRIDVATASDDEVVDAIAVLIDAFMKSLDFSRGAGGDFNASPFDVFLVRNGLPRHPNAGESDLDFLRRLRSSVAALANPVFVGSHDGTFRSSNQPFVFGAVELEGLTIFLAEPATSPPSAQEIAQGGIGNCLVCHQGPLLTDFLVHNVGATQEEYDAIHGTGAFFALPIPDLNSRAANPDLYLPPSAAHPAAEGVFRRIPDAAHPQYTDLGVWNTFANPDIPAPQTALTEMLSLVNGLTPGSATPATLLSLAIGAFKTPALRSTGLSAPYFHTGRFDVFEQVNAHYMTFAAKARAGLVRNPDPQLRDIALIPSNIAPLAAFMRCMNEDYE